MKVVNVKKFTFKGSSSSDKVYFVKGIEDYMILIYNTKFSEFLFAPVKYLGNKTEIEDIIKEIDDNVPLVSRLRIKLAKASNILNVNLGKARFCLTHYFKNELERDLYLKELKNAQLIPHERYSYEIDHHLSGFVEYDEDILNFVNSLKNMNELNLKKIKDNKTKISKEI